MLNEKETTIPIKSEIAPFYFWKDVEKFYRDYIGYLYRDIKNRLYIVGHENKNFICFIQFFIVSMECCTTNCFIWKTRGVSSVQIGHCSSS
ncbi:histidine acid phosphatase [Bacteroides uniformis]|uniref:Histidine acid phosphatase n=1 Tax=Bacteroides uniformis TaxID=820 RepID=A0A174VPT4_BACUN|nr:histidine acid phosphatase [Bacteroides uniformis]